MASSRWHRDVEVAELIDHLNQEPKFAKPESLTVSEQATILKEIDRCRSDFVYAARNYFWITNKKAGDQLFSLWPGQELILQKILEIKSRGLMQKVLIIKARQLGAVHPDTKVLTADLRWVRMDDLTVGDYVMSVNEHVKGTGAGRKFQKARILRKWDVVKPAYRLTMANGEALVATADHKFLCKKRNNTEYSWVAVDQKEFDKKTRSPIRVGDEIRFSAHPWETAASFEDGWFTGLLDGEGSYRAKKTGGMEVTVSQVDGAVLKRAKSYLSSRGYNFRIESDQRKAGESSKFGNQPVYKLVIGNIPQVLRLIGSLRPSRFIGRELYEGKELPSGGNGISTSKVVSIDILPEQRMVDIETEAGTFIANGFITHNCSTLIEALIAHSSMFFSGRNALIVSSDRSHVSDVLFPILQFIYDRMPWWMQPAAASRKEEGMFFENPDPKSRRFNPGLNSRIYVKSANSTTGVGEGIRLNAVHASEFAGWDERIAIEVIDENMSNALAENADTFAILESTAKGTNTYGHKLWRKNVDLVEQAEWYPLFLPWFFEDNRRRTVTVDFHLEKQEFQMRQRIVNEWCRCDYDPCQQFHYRYLRGEDRSESVCVTCGTGKLSPFVLADDQLAWIQHRRRNAAKDDKSLKKLSQEMACVVGGTAVSSDNGIGPISMAVNARYSEHGKVTGWYDHGVRDTVVLSTRLGRQLICTPGHRIYLPSGECVPASELVYDQEIALSPPILASQYHTATWDFVPGCQMSINVDEEWGRLLGYFMGDGCWSNGGMRFACDAQDADVAADIAALCEKKIGRPTRVFKSSSSKMLVVQTSYRDWSTILWGLGCLYQRKDDRQYRRHVKVPDCIWRSPASVVKEFLSALFECDGHAYKDSPRTVFFTRHEEFARDVQLLLLGFGINSRIAAENKTNGEGRIYEGRSVQLSAEASNLFHEQIGFISKRKTTTACVRPPGKNVTKRSRNVMSDHVLAVVPHEPARVFDLTIADTHRFGANGILVHNSTAEEAFQVSGIQIFGDAAQAFANSTILPPVFWGDFDKQGRIHGLDVRRHEFKELNGWFHCFQEDCSMDHTYDEAPLRLWEWPIADAQYCCGADIAEGLGGKNAYSVGCVIRLGGAAGDFQVATWRSNTVGPIPFSAKLNHLGRMYNTALMAPEVNRYDIVLGYLRLQYNYGNIYRWKHLDSINMNTSKLGWWTTMASRPRLWQTFKAWLQQEVFYVRSDNLAEEMKYFTKEYEEDYMASGDRDFTDDELLSCYDSGVLIRTKYGVCPIEDVKVGDLVLTHRGRFMPVVAVNQRHEPNRLYEIEAVGRQTIRLTGNHPILVWEKYRQYRHEGKPVCWNKFRNPVWMSVDQADGALDRYGSCYPVPIGETDKEFIDLAEFVPSTHRVYEKDGRIGFITGRRSPTLRTVPRYLPLDKDLLRLIGYYMANGGKGSHNLIFATHDDHLPVREWIKTYLESIGLHTGIRAATEYSRLLWCSTGVLHAFFSTFGVKNNKKMPDWVMDLPPAKQRQILIGYLLGDGTFRGMCGAISSVTVSPIAAHQLFEMSLRCDWPANFFVRQPQEGGLGNFPQWNLQYSAQTSSKIKDLIEPELLACKKPSGIAVTGRTTAQVKLDHGYLISKIKSVTEVPFSGTVYNLQVAEDNSYVADGTTVHNCMIALYVAHESDYNDSLDMITPRSDLTMDSAQFRMTCLSCHHQWPSNKMNDLAMTPESFAPSEQRLTTDGPKTITAAGGMVCPRCKSRSLQVERNPGAQAWDPMKSMENQLWAEAGGGGWSPDSEWSRKEIPDYDSL